MKRVGLLLLAAALGTHCLGAALEPRRPLDVPADDRALLDRIERDALAYFWYETDPETGLTKDRAGTLGPDRAALASSAATGFGLTALVVGVERGLLDREAARARALVTLRAARDRWPAEHGFYYHFMDVRSAQRAGTCELSSVDTALFFYGALLAGSAFGGEAADLARALHERLDWAWMLNGDTRLSHGWRPEQGFIPYRWDTYSETLLVNLLAQMHPTRPLPAACWTAWNRDTLGEYAGRPTYPLGLFVFNYNGCWIDWRGRPDVRAGGADYHAAAVNAVRINQLYALDPAAGGRFGYDAGFWGLSATDTPEGYRARRAPPGQPDDDGTICPWALVGALPWAPELVKPTLRSLLTRYGGSVYGRYGFVSGANRQRNWVHEDAIGIDVGSGLCGIANERDGLVWRLFERLPETKRGLARVGLRVEG
ncbi:MAG: hypothetical protein HZB16_17200 [Armatimonadetes bacterium]|nr:hypothetical protein [Armatimonadota bacterium]